jgi:hypothetical protein
VTLDTPTCLARIADALPELVIDRHVRSQKCVVAFGELAGARVCVKMLHHDAPPWAWYFAREQLVLDQLPATLPAPRLRMRVTSESATLLVVDELAGRALAHHRHVARPPAPALVEACLALAEQIESLALAPASPPSPAITKLLRRRLLEDPSAPLEWVHAGIDRCASRGHLAAAQAERMHAALDAYPRIASCHGDFLPRNLIADGRHVAACDWECAGPHARDWDRALLWANLGERERAPIEAAVAAPGERARAFRALAGFALARELEFAARATPARRLALRRRLEGCV